MMRRWPCRLLATLAAMLCIATVLLATRSGWIASKAVVAQYLLEHAWRESVLQGKPVRPWPWADTLPVARLDIPAMELSLIVLSDASGEAMAFGPGLVTGLPEQAENTTIVLGGHRDTHLAFVNALQPGATLLLESLSGQRWFYTLAQKSIVDTREQGLAVATQRPGLVLLTCYPFNALQTGGPLRMVATALAANRY